MPGHDGRGGRQGGQTRQNPPSEKARLKRSLPLYAGIGLTDQPEEPCVVSRFVQDPNHGLLFDKFIDTWMMKDGEFREQKPGEHNASDIAKAGGKRTFLDEAKKRGCNNTGLAEYHKRRNQLLDMLDGKPIPFQTNWRFVSGLGSGHPYEAGFVWHRTLGVPYLPGSSVKGLIRAWAEQWNPKTWDEFKRLFGDMDTDSVGTLIIFDAIPAEAPKLEVDIMNPHYSEYYQDPQHTPPADYLSPKPVFFLAVAESAKFTFALAPRRLDNDFRASRRDVVHPDVERGFTLLTEALEYLGTGGKTAVGYGRMKPPSNSQTEPKSTISDWQECEVHYDRGRQMLVVTPNGGKEIDCKPESTKNLMQNCPVENHARWKKGKPVKAKVIVEKQGNYFAVRTLEWTLTH